MNNFYHYNGIKSDLFLTVYMYFSSFKYKNAQFFQQTKLCYCAYHLKKDRKV